MRKLCLWQGARPSKLHAVVVAALACAHPNAASATTFGTAGEYIGGVNWTAYGSQTTTTAYLAPGGWDVPFVGGIPFKYSATATSGNASAVLAISATPEYGNIGLHGFGSGSFSGSQFEGSIAEASFDLYSYDTFHVGGSVGALEQFQYSLTLDAISKASSDGYSDGTDANGGLGFFADSNWVGGGSVTPFVPCDYNGGLGSQANGNPCGQIGSIDAGLYTPGSQTITGTVTLIGGTTIQLGELLWGRPYAGYAQTASAVFDASNTGYFTLTPLTAGASFTTDSGLTYANSPDIRGAVPEPATWAMMLLGFGAIGWTMRRNSGRSGRLQLA